MKRILKYFLLAIAILGTGVILASCGDDKDSDEPGFSEITLVGKWNILSTTTEYYTTIPEMEEYYNRTDTEKGDGAYWEFTDTYVIQHDPNSIMNNQPVDYSYNETTSQLHIGGGFDLTYSVKTFTASKLILYMDTHDDKFGKKTTIEFNKTR